MPEFYHALRAADRKIDGSERSQFQFGKTVHHRDTEPQRNQEKNLLLFSL